MRKISAYLIVLVMGIIALPGCGREEEKPPAATKQAPASVSSKKDVQPGPERQASKGTRKRKARPRPEKMSDSDVDDMVTEVKRNMESGAALPKSGGRDAIARLGRSRNPKAVPVLTEVLADSPDPRARRMAARSLGMISDDSAVEALEKAVNDDYIWVRLNAALGLVRQGKKEIPLKVFSDIIEQRGADEWKVDTSVLSRRTLTDSEKARVNGNVEKMKSQTFPLLALSGLRMINTPEALEVVKKAAQSDNPRVKQKAETILSSAGKSAR